MSNTVSSTSAAGAGLVSEGTLLEAVREAIVQAAGKPVAVTPETSIVRDLALDSVTVMNLVLSLEERLDLIIPIDRLSTVDTVGDLVGVVAACRREQAPGGVA